MSVFNTGGFLIPPEVLTLAHCDEVISALTRVHNSRAGSRNLLNHRWCRDLERAGLQALPMAYGQDVWREQTSESLPLSARR